MKVLEATVVLGAIVGDIVGSVYEWHNIKVKDFLCSPLTVALRTILL